jgi:hypothetical protein
MSLPVIDMSAPFGCDQIARAAVATAIAGEHRLAKAGRAFPGLGSAVQSGDVFEGASRS